MADEGRWRFGVFEVDAARGELRKQGIRIKLSVQPLAVLLLLIERPGELLTREEIARRLWPDGTFVDFEQGVNSAVNRLRDALGDRARNPRFIETLARRGYRFVAPVERLQPSAAPASAGAASQDRPTVSKAGLLATPAELPETPRRTVRLLFLLLQAMYLGFYVGALANLPEIGELFSALSRPMVAMAVLLVTAALLIPVRTFLVCGVLFQAPEMRRKYLQMWPCLLPFDVLWSLAPFLLLHHVNAGLALACVAPLVYSPFAQRSLVLMGAAERDPAPATAAEGKFVR